MPEQAAAVAAATKQGMPIATMVMNGFSVQIANGSIVNRFAGIDA